MEEFEFTAPVYHDGKQYHEGDRVSAAALHSFLNYLMRGGFVAPITRLEPPAPDFDRPEEDE